jgi:type II secretion system protein H
VIKPMPSAASQSVRRDSIQGFTLVEILLVLALLVLGAAVLLPSVSGLFRTNQSGSPEEVVAEVLQQARREAVLTGKEVALHFEPETQRFVWDGSAGRALGSAGPRLKVDFLRPRATAAILVGGQLVETAVVPAVKFFPDGTCEPVRVQFRPAGGTPRVIAIDPWTCAPGLEVKS